MEVVIREIGCRKQLLIDDWIVEDIWQAPRRIHHPRKHPRNPLIVPDRPCESNTLALYGSVAPAPGGGYRMWYNTFSHRPRTGEDVPAHAYRVCYAESDDGIQWRKPNVGLWEWCGSKDNNLVLCEDMPALGRRTCSIRPGPSGWRWTRGGCTWRGAGISVGRGWR